MSRSKKRARNSGIIVQKYGGTSVGTPERIGAVAKRVASLHRKGVSKIAVVVSAMSGETNRLVDLVARVNPAAAAKHYDMAVAAGEQVSVGLTAAALEAAGVGAEAFLAYQVGIVTDRAHGAARIRRIKTDALRSAWRKGKIPVIAGFQGVTDSMDITTLGRGGSDTSAVALAVALGAAYCEINTDVDGVYTADPRCVPQARLIDRLDYETALELAALGSKVLHNRCVEVAAKYEMPIVVRNSFKPTSKRSTRIMPLKNDDALEAPVVSGITTDKNVVKVTVSSIAVTSKALTEVFDTIAGQGINVDIIIHNRQLEKQQDRFGFTVGKADLAKTLRTLRALKRKRAYGKMEINVDENLAKVSAVGLGMRSHSGVAGRVFRALTRNGVEILMISTSEIKISCVVAQRQADKAARALHKTFF